MADDEIVETRAQTGSRIMRAALFYFAIVFGAGALLGAPRTLWLEPWLGKTLAVAIEAPLLLAAMWIGARAAPRWAGLSPGLGPLLALGLLAFALQQVADLSLGFGFRGMPFADQLRYFATPPGYIYAACLIAFAFMPLLRAQRSA